MSNHTPGPWRRSMIDPCRVMDEAGTVATFRTPESAEMATRARNAHDDMLAALKSALVAVCDHSATCSSLHHDKSDLHEMHMPCPVERRISGTEATVRAAIAKAEGR